MFLASAARWRPNSFQADEYVLRVWYLAIYQPCYHCLTIAQRLVTPTFSEMNNLLPDLSPRQPSVTALIPLLMTYYALAVLAILPKTFLLRLLLQPVFVWQAWRCIADVDLAAWVAQSLGLKSDVRLSFFNSPLPVRLLFTMMLP